MGIGRVIYRGRRAAEAIMSTTVRVRRYTGKPVTDPETGQVTRSFSVVYEGKAKIAAYEAFEQVRDVAGSQQTLSRTRVDFPVGSFSVLPGDEVHVISDSADAMLAGKVLRVTVPAPYKSHATALRCFVEEVSKGG